MRDDPGQRSVHAPRGQLQVARDGVTDILVQLDDRRRARRLGRGVLRRRRGIGRGGDRRRWRRSSLGRDPWNREAMRRDVFTHGLWQFRAGTGNFAWAGHRHGALATSAAAPAASRSGACSAALQPQRGDVLLLPRARRRRRPRRAGRRRARAAATRSSTSRSGSTTRRTSRWSPPIARDARRRPAAAPRRQRQLVACPQALRNLRALAEHDIDFVEQPVRDHPIGQLAELRARTPMARLRERGAVVGGRRVRAHPCAPGRRLLLLPVLGRLDRARSTGSRTSPSTRGCRSASTRTASSGSPRPPRSTSLLTLPNSVEGHQQTAHLMEHDVLAEPLPIATRPALGRARRARARRRGRRGRRRGGGRRATEPTASTCRGRRIRSTKEER